MTRYWLFNLLRVENRQSIGTNHHIDGSIPSVSIAASRKVRAGPLIPLRVSMYVWLSASDCTWSDATKVMKMAKKMQRIFAIMPHKAYSIVKSQVGAKSGRIKGSLAFSSTRFKWSSLITRRRPRIRTDLTVDGQVTRRDTVRITHSTATEHEYARNSMKAFWFFKPTQLFTQGQWWSIRSTHDLHTEQWWVRSGLTAEHFLHVSPPPFIILDG